jgi:hypothetical protein
MEGKAGLADRFEVGHGAYPVGAHTIGHRSNLSLAA